MPGNEHAKETQHDVFLPYDSAAKPATEELAHRLTKEDIQPTAGPSMCRRN